MEMRAAGLLPPDDTPAFIASDFAVESKKDISDHGNGTGNGLVCDGRHFISASSKARPLSCGDRANSNLRKSPSQGSLRGIFSILQTGSFRGRAASGAGDGTLKPVAGSDPMLSARDTGKPPSGIDISRLRTKSGKNLFKVVAEEAQSGSRSRQQSMTGDDKSIRLTSRGVLTHSPGTARSGGSGDTSVLGDGIAGSLLLPSRSLHGGAKHADADSANGGSLTYAPSVASQLGAVEGNLSDSELASNATNSFDCVDDLKVISELFLFISNASNYQSFSSLACCRSVIPDGISSDPERRSGARRTRTQRGHVPSRPHI